MENHVIKPLFRTLSLTFANRLNPNSMGVKYSLIVLGGGRDNVYHVSVLTSLFFFFTLCFFLFLSHSDLSLLFLLFWYFSSSSGSDKLSNPNDLCSTGTNLLLFIRQVMCPRSQWGPQVSGTSWWRGYICSCTRCFVILWKNDFVNPILPGGGWIIWPDKLTSNLFIWNAGTL